jgi:hypothetical protein
MKRERAWQLEVLDVTAAPPSSCLETESRKHAKEHDKPPDRMGYD